MIDQKYLYFAYASNMNPFQMLERCPTSEFYMTGSLKDYTLYYPIFSKKRNCFVASLKQSIGDITEGVIWRLDDIELKKLDKFESLGKNYNRTVLEIDTKKGKIDCIIYLAIHKDNNEGLPSQEYIDTINEGKKYYFPS